MITSNEKPARKPRDLLEVLSTVLRIFQWLSALFIYTVVSLRLSSIKVIQDDRVRSIQPLMTIAVTYSTLTILILIILKKVEKLRVSTWHIVTMASLPADTVMLGLCAAQHVIFNIRSFECAAVMRADMSFFTDDFRANIYLLGQHGDTVGCLFPLGVYSLCIIAFFSYLISIMLNVAQLLQYRKTTISEKEQDSHPGRIEAQIPVHYGRREMMERSSTPASIHSVESMDRRALPQRPAPIEEPKYANIPAEIFASMAVGPSRVSTETASSLDPDSYLVSDGFRRPEDPPAYSSRPGSLRSLPEYTSRPSSMYTVVL